jgi:hypothetical protein
MRKIRMIKSLRSLASLLYKLEFKDLWGNSSLLAFAGNDCYFMSLKTAKELVESYLESIGEGNI